MDILQKARILGDAGKYDSCGPKRCEVKVSEGLSGIYYAKSEHKTCKIFKTLMNNSCSYDCKYCPNASGCKTKKVFYQPNELASLFNHLHEKLDVNGLFLSSGVAKNADYSTEKMIEAIKLVRNKYHFKGYIHFKVLPGTSYHLIKQASELADRMSINIEAPNSSALSELSTNKDYKSDILKRQAWISKLALNSGQTTQIILNSISTDKDVLKMADWEYSNLSLKRMYFSSFKPIKGTPLENEKAEPLVRQNHLYNADFLIRSYGYNVREFYSVMSNGMLPREDPKLALAKAFFDRPLDLNEASYNELIRIPGIGPETAKKILQQKTQIKTYAQFHQLGGWVKRAKPFIEIDGKRQTMLMEF
ncbi:MAG: radical SAM protein [Candidatus Woesearchaeota archaeon]